MTRLLFHPEVELEIQASYFWYEAQAEGLGDGFVSELENAYQAILELPVVWPIFKDKFRRYILARFPFSVIYRQSSDTVFVVAVMHHSRKPNYWRNRT
ncbi:type II toxin-antitoxin system RelE/ParE family toxin [Methylomonas sp. UP202]|uniref:type II toxin-antitoxin system RelE/ParE family toxin n=1 Tax=Methylomonas sp. UP202 TaxID=3040943 RepID=UPI002478808C|nr:type II toxin-antitoxin system RelE/ParE family toxin [Methylomonas sp. UP202]WGS84331.1 type II toxin-antitoxin system RelE/ParE family toxin [Methylomonas sp. UP202]